MEIKTIEAMRTANGMLIISTVDADPATLGELVRKANGGGYDLKIAPITKKRSLDANSYYWVLLGRLAGVLGASNDELHAMMIDRYGVLRTREDETPVTFTLRSDIPPTEVTPYARVFKTGEIKGKSYTVYGVLKGSSEMTSKEFSTLLDGLISECKEQGVETMTPIELMRLKGYEQ